MRSTATSSKPAIRSSLVALLVVMAGASIWAILNPRHDEDFGVELTNSRSNSSARINISRQHKLPQAAQELMELPERQLMVAASRDIFKAQNWTVVDTKKKTNPAPLPPPSAPSAPHLFVGKYETESGETLVFLTAYNKVYTVKPGSNIDATWRLDSEEGQILKLTYLPLNLPQTISKLARGSMDPATAGGNNPPVNETNS